MWNTGSKRLLVVTVVVGCILPLAMRRGAEADAPAATKPATQPDAETGPSGTTVVKLTLRPSAIRQPVLLQYHLLPSLTEQEPGDAATLYAIAARIAPDHDVNQDVWGAVFHPFEPLTELAQDAKAERLLKLCAPTLRYLDLAGHRYGADWDEGFRERGLWWKWMPYSIDLGIFAKLQALQARFQISRGDLPGALRTMQNGLAMARHMSRDSESGMSAYGASAVTWILGSSGFAWIGQDGSPNLYWALSSLPEPFLSLWDASEKDQAAVYFTVPALRKARDGDLTLEQWSHTLAEMIRVNRSLSEKAIPSDAGPPTELIQKALPSARQYLVSIGMTRETVEAMPAVQAVGKFFFEQFRDLSDDAWGAWQLPYPQAILPLRRLREVYARQKADGMPNPFLERLQYLGLSRTWLARSEQMIALLRVVEAMRDYSASYDGQPPDRLEQITNVPVPCDPLSDKPFLYHRAGRAAVLGGPATIELDGWSPWRGYQIEITFARTSPSK